jgi:hypothetical protein
MQICNLAAKQEVYIIMANMKLMYVRVFKESIILLSDGDGISFQRGSNSTLTGKNPRLIFTATPAFAKPLHIKI